MTNKTQKEMFDSVEQPVGWAVITKDLILHLTVGIVGFALAFISASTARELLAKKDKTVGDQVKGSASLMGYFVGLFMGIYGTLVSGARVVDGVSKVSEVELFKKSIKENSKKKKEEKAQEDAA